MPLKRLKDIPGPRTIADQWSLYRRRYQMGHVLREISQSHGDIARIPIAGAPKVLVSHPEQVREVLVSNSQYLGLSGQDLLRRVAEWSLIAIEGQIHDEHRSLMLLSLRKILTRRILGTTIQRSNQALAQLRDGDVVDLYKFSREVSLAIAASLLFPAEAGDEIVAKIDHKAFLDLMSQSNAWFLGMPLPFQNLCLLADLRHNIKVLATRRHVRRQLNDAIQKARALTRSGPNADVLSLLTDGTEIGGRMRDEFLEDNLLTILLASYDTTANVLAWAMWETARLPTLQTRVAAEGSRLSDNPADNLEWSNTANWTEATLQESLRMYPSVWATSRRTLSDYRLGDYLLPRNTFIYTSQWVTHRDPRWFADPFTFQPERWRSAEAEASATAVPATTPSAANPTGTTGAAPATDAACGERPQFAFFPFGGGKRFCIGKAIFDQEAALLLASFYSRWDVTPIEDCHPEQRFGIMMQPDRPMLVRIQRRSPTG